VKKKNGGSEGRKSNKNGPKGGTATYDGKKKKVQLQKKKPIWGEKGTKKGKKAKELPRSEKMMTENGNKKKKKKGRLREGFLSLEEGSLRQGKKS